MPVPSKYELTGGKFRLDSSFTVSINNTEESRTLKAANRMLQRLADRTGLFLSHPFTYLNNKSALLQIETNRIGDLKLGEDESYNLIVTEKKSEPWS